MTLFVIGPVIYSSTENGNTFVAEQTRQALDLCRPGLRPGASRGVQRRGYRPWQTERRYIMNTQQLQNLRKPRLVRMAEVMALIFSRMRAAA